MPKIPIQTELIDCRKEDGAVRIVQKIVNGPDSVLDRTVSLYFIAPKDAIVFAVKILKELVPAYCLKDQVENLKLMAEHAEKS